MRGLPDTFQTPKFFDAHVHLRDDDLLALVAPETARYCSRAVVMPNVPEVLNARQAVAYRTRVLSAILQTPFPFQALMTVKLNHDTTPEMIREAHEAGVAAGKVYPEGVTTGARNGVRELRMMGPVLREMERVGLVLCVHGEAPEAFVLDREVAYLKQVDWVTKGFPSLHVVLEHVTTAEACRFVHEGPETLAATVTAHHLCLTLDDVIGHGLRPHHFCYPVPKRAGDRLALRAAAIGRLGGRFFLGSDSAPHRVEDKQSACGCAGVYSAPVLPAVLAEVFDQHGGTVDDLVDFTSRRGEAFYRLDSRPKFMTFRRKPSGVPGIVGGTGPLHIGGVVPFRAGESMGWTVSQNSGS